MQLPALLLLLNVCSLFFGLIISRVQTRGALLEAAGSEPHIGRVLGANFAAGMLAGGIAAAATCPLDVVKTWRQIEVCFELSIRCLF